MRSGQFFAPKRTKNISDLPEVPPRRDSYETRICFPRLPRTEIRSHPGVGRASHTLDIAG